MGDFPSGYRDMSKKSQDSGCAAAPKTRRRETAIPVDRPRFQHFD
jgi:hypothetical protein